MSSFAVARFRGSFMTPRCSISMPGSVAGRQPLTQNFADLVAFAIAFDSHSTVVDVFMGHLRVEKASVVAGQALGRPARSSPRLVRPQEPSSGVISSHISCWCNQMGSAFLAMHSSTGTPSINCGRGTRFCLPLIKVVMYFALRSRRVLRWAAVNLRCDFATCLPHSP